MSILAQGGKTGGRSSNPRAKKKRRPKVKGVAVVFASVFSPAIAPAASLFWDGTGTTWNATGPWSTSSSSSNPAFDPAAKPGASDIANFNISTVNTAQTVSLDAAQSAAGLVFSSTGTVLIQSGSGTNTLTLGSSGITVNSGAGADTISAAVALSGSQIWTNNSSNTLSVSGNVSNGSNGLTVSGAGNTSISGIVGGGSGGLVKSGSGTLTLNNSNTFTGGVTINAGTLVLSGPGALNSTSPNSVLFGAGSTGTLDLSGGSHTISGLNSSTGSPVVQNGVPNGATLTVDTATSNFFTGVIKDGSIAGSFLSLVKSGGGILTLTGNNTFTGLVTLNAGTLNLNSANQFTSGVIINGGSLNIGNNAALNASGGNAVTFGPSSSGILSLLGHSVTIRRLNTDATPGSPIVRNLNATAATLTISNADASAADTYAGSIQDGAGGGALSLVKAGASSLTLSGTVSLTGGIHVNGGTVTLGGNNSFTGGVTIGNGFSTSGTVVLANPGALNSVTPNGIDFTELSSGDSLSLKGNSVSINGINSNNAINPIIQNASATPATLTLPAGSSTAFGGTIQNGAGGGALSLVIAGDATVGGNNTFTGGVTINGNGSLVIGPGALNSANPNSVTFGPASTGTLSLLDSSTTVSGLNTNASAGTPVVQNGGVASATLTVNNAAANTYGGILADGGDTLSLTKSGGGTLTLSGNNTFTGGVQVDGGTLRVSSASNLGAAGAVVINSGGILAATATFTLSSARPFSLGPVTASGTPTIDIAAGQTLTLGGAGSNSGGNGALLKTGAGTLALTGSASSYTGGTTVQQGTLQTSGDAALGAASAAVTVNALGILNYTNTASSARPFTLNGGTLSVADTRTLTLNNATVAGGFLTGPGIFAVTGGTLLSATNAAPSAVISQTGAATVTNFTNNGVFSNAAGQTLTWNNGANTSAGRLTVNGTANVSDFVSDGTLTINPGGTINDNISPMVLGGGSTTSIGSSGSPGGTVNLAGQTLELRGGLLANYGTISNGEVHVYYGSLAAGTGTFPTVVLHPGGAFTPGVTLANIPPPSGAGTAFIRPLDPNQSTAASVLLDANTLATVNSGDGALTFTNPLTGPGETLTKVGGGTLTLAALRVGGLAVQEGTVKIIPNATAAATSTLDTLSISAPAKLDLSDNKLIARSTPIGSFNGSAYTGLTGLIQSGRNGGGWGGSGIVTSQSSATSGNFTSIGIATAAQVKGIVSTATALWAGQTVTGTDALIMYTYGGDANLDGKINVDDYGRIDFNVNLGTAGWFNGDFNYDGKINVDDYGIIDFNVGIQGAPFPTASQPFAGLAAVPEPGGCGILAWVVSAALAARRRRQKSL